MVNIVYQGCKSNVKDWPGCKSNIRQSITIYQIRKLYSSCKFIKYEHDKGIKDLYGLLSMYINMHIYIVSVCDAV